MGEKDAPIMHWDDESEHLQCSGSLPPLPGDYSVEAVTFGLIILAAKINLLRWKNNKPPSRVKTHLPPYACSKTNAG